MIDEQHQHYFDIINRISDHLDSGQMDRVILGGILKELVDYAFYHLLTEEKYFQEFKYEDTAHHVEMHNVYRNMMQEYLRRAQDASIDAESLFSEISQFAIDWFASHILVEDKKYSHCFNDHGLK
jgi:hemerythrin-like metal-binding protein